MLTRLQKEQMVNELTENLKASPVVVVADYKGLSVEKITEFRDAIREKGGKFKIYKNTLLKIALKNVGIEDEEFHSQLLNTNAVLFVKEDGDPMDVLKALVKFEKDNKLPAIKVGSFEGTTYDAEGVRELSKLPSRFELLGMLANVMQSPIVGVTRALNGIILKLAYALNAIKDQKGE